MAGEAKTTAGKKYVAEVTTRRVWIDYPTLETEVRYVRVGVKYKDLITLYFDIPEGEWTPEREDEETDKIIEAELKRLGRIK
jgi:hypothetical protein